LQAPHTQAKEKSLILLFAKRLQFGILPSFARIRIF
jgi:hypothetical protein